MPEYKVKTPDGGVVTVNAPEGATPEQAIEFVAKTWKPKATADQQQPSATQEKSFTDRVGEDWSNRLQKTKDMAARNSDGIIDTVANAPKIAVLGAGQVAGGINDVIGEGLRSGYNALVPEGAKTAITNKLAEIANTDTGKTLINAGQSVASGYRGFADKYPDSAMALEGAGNIFAAAPSLALAGKATAKTLEGAGNLTGWAGKNVLGVTTGQGPENIATAFKSGLKGDTSFYQNMAGEVPKEQVVERARDILSQMRQEFSNKYRQRMQSTQNSTARIPFDRIDDALDSVTASMREGGHWKIDEAERGVLGKIKEAVDEWGADPSMHNPIGMDALKQRIDAIYPESPKHNQAQRAVTSIRNAVKDAIVDVSPEYATAMKGYEEALGLERELTKAFSLNDKASIDTSLRKLQSLARNNVNANYGYRLDLAKALDDAGGGDLLPAIAGQSMNSWSPRGLAGIGSGATLGSVFYTHNPSLLAMLPFQSPRAVGSSLYGAGRAVGATGDALSGAKEGVSNALARLFNPNGNAIVQPTFQRPSNTR